MHGLKVVAVAVVAQAVLGMMRTLAPDRERATIAAVAAVAMLALPFSWAQVVVIVLGGLIGAVLLRAEVPTTTGALPLRVSHRTGGVFLATFFALLVGLPLLAAAVPAPGIELFDAFYRTGSLVFGGGHVVLPLLQSAVVPRGWVNNDTFLAGYGAAQAVPEPLFTFAAYLGAVMNTSPNGWAGAVLCLVAIFLPSFVLVISVLPFWESLRRRQVARSALQGVNDRGAIFTRVCELK